MSTSARPSRLRKKPSKYASDEEEDVPQDEEWSRSTKRPKMTPLVTSEKVGIRLDHEEEEDFTQAIPPSSQPEPVPLPHRSPGSWPIPPQLSNLPPPPVTAAVAAVPLSTPTEPTQAATFQKLFLMQQLYHIEKQQLANTQAAASEQKVEAAASFHWTPETEYEFVKIRTEPEHIRFAKNEDDTVTIDKSDRHRDWDEVMRRLREKNIYVEREKAQSKWRTMKSKFQHNSFLIASPSTPVKDKIKANNWKPFQLLKRVWGEERARLQTTNSEMGTTVHSPPAAGAALTSIPAIASSPTQSNPLSASIDFEQTVDTPVELISETPSLVEGESLPTSMASVEPAAAAAASSSSSSSTILFASHGPAPESRRSKSATKAEASKKRDTEFLTAMQSMFTTSIEALMKMQAENTRAIVAAIEKSKSNS